MTFDDEVAAAIEKVRREQGKGLSEAVNDLIRAGLVSLKARTRQKPFVQRTYPVAFKIDVANVWEAIEAAEGPNAR